MIITGIIKIIILVVVYVISLDVNGTRQFAE